MGPPSQRNVCFRVLASGVNSGTRPGTGGFAAGWRLRVFTWGQLLPGRGVLCCPFAAPASPGRLVCRLGGLLRGDELVELVAAVDELPGLDGAEFALSDRLGGLAVAVVQLV